MSRLTSRSLASGASLNDLIHIVITGDTSQSAQGSSYKASLSQLVPLFGGPDVFVTGGTYSNVTGTATFRNTTGGTFNVTGFTTGGTSGTSILVTGGTANSTGGTMTFTNSTGGTFTVTGVTTPFSGGSGNCITNLYVDNIRACTNEITVFNRVQSTGSDAQNTLSFAWGLTNVASANYSFAFGTGTTASGYASHAEGIDTIASGVGSHAEGSLSIASGTTSHAEGDSTIAGGQASHSEGYSTNASGNYSHAEGYGSASNGSFSHAQNKTTTSRGSSSHAGGNQSITDGPNSFVHGFINYVGGESTAVLGGQYNNVLSGSTNNSGIFGGERNVISGVTSFSDPAYNSVIIGGSGNTITNPNSSIIASESSKLIGDHSVILGGYNITGTSAETVFVPNFVLYPTYTYTPSGTTDLPGKPVGTVTWDDNYFYYKGTTGWRRISGATW